MKYNCWLQGNLNYMATSMAIVNCFGKENTKAEFPSYEKLFKNQNEEKTKTPEEIDNYVHSLNNQWARF